MATQAELEAQIASLEAVKLAILSGTKRSEVTGSQGGGVKYQMASVPEINQEIARLKVQLAAMTGERSGVGPVIATFGGQG